MHTDILTILADYVTYKTARRLFAISYIPIYITAYIWYDNMDNNVIAYNNGAILYNNNNKLCYKYNRCEYSIPEKFVEIQFYRDGYRINMDYCCDYIDITKFATFKIDEWNKYKIYNNYYINIYNNEVKSEIEYDTRIMSRKLHSEYSISNIKDIAELINKRLRTILK